MADNRKLEAVLFDMDGVVVDSEPLWTEAEKQLLARRNLPYSPSLKTAMMGRDARGAVGFLMEHYALAESLGELIEERNQLIAELFRSFGHPHRALRDALGGQAAHRRHAARSD